MLLSPDQLSSPTRPDFEDMRSNGSEVGWAPRARLTSITSVLGAPLPFSATLASGLSGDAKESKEELIALSTVWKQIMDPVLEYCQVCSVAT
jgi:vacuolar protein sorting-associated protein 52